MACSLRTYVYHVYDNSSHTTDLGWYPFKPFGIWSAPPKWPYTYVLDGTAGRLSEAENGEPWAGGVQATFDATRGMRFQVRLTKQVELELAVFDVAGRQVSREVRKWKEGPQEVWWDGTRDTGSLVPRGVYYYRLRADGASTVSAPFVWMGRAK
jgi:hypothetical protein